jgi:HK97 family phage major capsid protein
MKITKALKQWIVLNCGVKSDATEDEFKKAAAAAMVEGKLSTEKYVELTTEKTAEEANEFSTKLDRIADGLEKLSTHLIEKAKEPEKVPEPEKAKEPEKKHEEPPVEKAKPRSLMQKMFSMHGSDGVEDGEKEIEARVKEAAEMYSDTKSTLVYPATNKAGKASAMAGRPVMDYSEEGRPINVPSDRDRAVAGAWGQFMVAAASKRSKSLAWAAMPPHQKELILYAMEHMDWNGCAPDADGNMGDLDKANVIHRHLKPHERKALIDDATSGGVEAVPLPFDDMIVSTPILNGELFPLVNLVPLDRGRRIQGARAGTVTISWGGVDDTAISLFDTASYISAFDTTVYRGQGAIRVGLDFLSDTPIDFASFISQQYGDVMLQEMDDVIATGDGTTQPEGVMVKSGTTSVAWGGATSIGNYESLRFGVHKREHVGNMARTAVFCGTDTSYSRCVGLPVGTSDARRLFSTGQIGNYDGYTMMGRPYKINESLTNSQIFYAVLGRYRMYQRRGLTIRTSTEGDTLIRSNEMLLVVSFRYGGQLERGACAAVTSTAPA